MLKDYGKAVEWYRKAADQGEPAAQFSLGLMYEQGTGVNRNLTEADRWYRLAAKNGDPDAKVVLAQQNKGKTSSSKQKSARESRKSSPKQSTSKHKAGGKNSEKRP